MIKITLLIEIAPFHHTCVSVIDGSTNGSDVKFDAMNCLFLLSFNVFWAVSVSIMVVFFVSQRFFVRFCLISFFNLYIASINLYIVFQCVRNGGICCFLIYFCLCSINQSINQSSITYFTVLKIYKITWVIKLNFSNEKIMNYFQKFEYAICNGKC